MLALVGFRYVIMSAQPKADICFAMPPPYWRMIEPDAVAEDNSLMQRFEAVLSHEGELTMWSEWMVDSWGYGGYGPFHMIVWIICDCHRGRCRVASC